MIGYDASGSAIEYFPMPEGVKAKRILTGDSFMPGMMANIDYFGVLGDDDVFYVFDGFNHRFYRNTNLPDLSGCSYSLHEKGLTVIDPSGKVSAFSGDSGDNDLNVQAAEFIEEAIRELNVSQSDIRGFYVDPMFGSIVVTKDKVVMCANFVWVEGSGIKLGGSVGEAVDVEVGDKRSTVAVVDISSILGDGEVQSCFFVRIKEGRYIISFDGGYTFFYFGTHSIDIEGEKIVFDSPIVSSYECLEVLNEMILIDADGCAWPVGLGEFYKALSGDGRLERVREHSRFSSNIVDYKTERSSELIIKTGGRAFVSRLDINANFSITLPQEIISGDILYSFGGDYHISKSRPTVGAVCPLIVGDGSLIGICTFECSVQ